MNDTLQRLLEITTVMEILQQAEDKTDVQTGAIVADSSGRIIHTTAGVQEIFGYNAEELRGLSLGDLMPARYRIMHEPAFARVAGGEQSRIAGKKLELTGLTSGGVEIPLALKVEVHDTAGLGRLYVGRIWSMRDIDRSVMLAVELAAGRGSDDSR